MSSSGAAARGKGGKVMSEHMDPTRAVKIGVVAYAPKVVTIWEGIKDYLRH
jgi:hypothetical protein